MLELLSDESGCVEFVQESSEYGSFRGTSPPDEDVFIQELVCKQAESREKKLVAQRGRNFHSDSPCKQAILYLVSERQSYWVKTKAHTVATDEL